MKTGIKGIGLLSILLLASFVIQAQNGNNSLVVSKGVQQVANKKKFADENKENTNIQVKTVAMPAMVVSKGVAQTSQEPAEGNIESKGYPTWAISKGVARKNQEMNSENAELNEYQEGTIPADTHPISKR